MGSLSDLPEGRYDMEETTTAGGEEENEGVEAEMEEERTQGGGRRHARGAKSSGRCVYGEEDGDGMSANGSGSEGSDAEYVPLSTNDEGYESDESNDEVSMKSKSKRAKRRQSSSSDIAQLIEQEAARHQHSK
jgi:hypothetical protein